MCNFFSFVLPSQRLVLLLSHSSFSLSQKFFPPSSRLHLLPSVLGLRFSSVSTVLADERVECFPSSVGLMKMKVRGALFDAVTVAMPHLYSWLQALMSNSEPEKHAQTAAGRRKERKRDRRGARHAAQRDSVFPAGSRWIFTTHHQAGIDIRLRLSPSTTCRRDGGRRVLVRGDQNDYYRGL